MLDQPGFVLSASPGEQDVIEAAGPYRDRIARALAGARERMGRLSAPGLLMTLHQSIPRHMGLGSGTQLALAVGQAVMGASVVAASKLADYVGRGVRSAIGVHGYESGGFLVDAGKRSVDALGDLAVRVSFPVEWRVLLWMPRGEGGLSGDRERRVFEQIPAMPAAVTDRLCAIVLRELLPAIHERDFNGFSHGLRSYGDRVGEFFAPVQGGTWTDSSGEEVARWLSQRGIVGVAQSSWGPAIAAVVPSVDIAKDLARDWPFAEGEVLVTCARNRGTDVVPLSGSIASQSSSRP